MNELAKRILFAVPAAALFLYVTWLGGFYFICLVILVALFIQREMSNICTKAGFKPDRYFIYTIALWVLLIPQLPYPFEVGLAIFLLFVAIQVFKRSESALQELTATLFCGLYGPVGLMVLLLVRDFGSDGRTGFALVLLLLLMIWGNDVFAYFGGRNFGRRALAPHISPNKTWEGFLFGILGAGAGLAIAYLAVDKYLGMSVIQALPLVVLVSMFGPLGDLTISKLKRAADIKDASGILPGHGGFLDRFDALILAAPVFYLYLYTLELVEFVSF